MKNEDTNRYTVENNIAVTNNICLGIATHSLDTHLVHLGTMGVYGYGSSEFPIPEGYQKVKFINSDESESSAKEILYPTDPGSIYHMTKSLDQILFQFYVKNYGIRVTDLHQGIVWGTQTAETRLHEDLVNRFDYDGDYGTVLNRFLVEAAIGYPLTVHGSGGQTRAFINIEDSVTCVFLASTKISQSHDNSRVRIMNQTAETATVIDLANLVLRKTGGTLELVDNPRKEADSNNLNAFNQLLQNLGWRPICLESHLLDEIIEMVEKYKTRVFVEKIPATSRW